MANGAWVSAKSRNAASANYFAPGNTVARAVDATFKVGRRQGKAARCHSKEDDNVDELHLVGVGLRDLECHVRSTRESL